MPFVVRFEWGERGVDALGPDSDITVVVDVLSFSTCVDVALGRGAIVVPYRYRDDSAAMYGREHGAMLAANERCLAGGYSLSPSSLAGIPAGTRLVLPSPNGAALSLRAAEYATTLTACLRNCAAVAEFARRCGATIAVIACGERWSDGGLRPAWEDVVGAGGRHLSSLIEPGQSYPVWSPDRAFTAVAALLQALEDEKGQL